MGLFNFMGGETKTAKYQLCCEVASEIPGS